ncbi:MAG TPA: hypothetical protein VJ506_02730 [Candidatus Limnocylindrales bacterium]|nr:hypothetical protein [Candidatus Limnocylindrales bacterium]
MNEGSITFPIELSPDELALVRAALEMLEDTLGHEEADELAEVQALLRRLPQATEAD